MIPRWPLAADYEISRIIKGGWHLAGDHGSIDPLQARKDMATFVEAGITTFDCADIYSGVELLIGSFRQAYPSHARELQVHTKFVPDLSELHSMDKRHVESTIDRSLHRLGMERLDLVQFHWWDYAVERYIDAALALDRLRRVGKIARIGVTNFDTAHLAQLVDAGIPIVSHQIQYSLIDNRPDNGMVEYCRAHGIALLCYGTVCGGFLSERWLAKTVPKFNFANRSLTKYKLIIDEFGGWDLFQSLLAALHVIAIKYGTDIATVASRAILDRPQVAATIVGATNTAHLPSHRQVGMLELDQEDLASINAITGRRVGPAGEVYGLERDRSGPHGRIMKYSLNATPSQDN
jgi:aryl-alcohol dehydrogenase-like predicted oxidoreductase